MITTRGVGAKEPFCLCDKENVRDTFIARDIRGLELRDMLCGEGIAFSIPDEVDFGDLRDGRSVRGNAILNTRDIQGHEGHSRAQVWVRRVRYTGSTTLCEESQRSCSKVAVLHNGEVTQCWTTQTPEMHGEQETNDVTHHGRHTQPSLCEKERK